MIENELNFQPAGRKHNLKLKAEVFSQRIGWKLLERMASHSTEKDFKVLRHYIGTIYDSFNILWDRQNIENIEVLKINAREFAEVAEELPSEENIEESSKQSQSIGHHTAVIRTLKMFGKILKKFPTLSFFALTLLVEYFLLLKLTFDKVFEKVIFNGLEVNGVGCWLGKTSSTIFYNSLDCPDEHKEIFLKTLKAWEETLPKTTNAELYENFERYLIQ